MSKCERRVLLISFLLLPLFWIGLRTIGLPRFQAWIDRFPVTNHHPLWFDEAAAIGAAVNVAAAHTPGPVTCLTRSLLLRSLLRRKGADSDLRIGVQIVDGKFAAHAWVEYDGRPINDAPDIATRFLAFDQMIVPGKLS